MNLNAFLTQADYDEIENMPVPTPEQAEKYIRGWLDMYSDTMSIGGHVFNVKTHYKLYLKCKEHYPEYCI